MVESKEDSDSDADYKGPSKKSRGATQSQVPGEAEPEAHAKERTRVVKSYVPKNFALGKFKLGGKRVTDPKSVLAVDRVVKHPNQSFKAKANNILYCQACATDVSVKESSITTHLKVLPCEAHMCIYDTRTHA